MKVERDLSLIKQIKAHSIRIVSIMSSKEKSDFDMSLDMKEIVCFNILQIGELSKKLSSKFLEEHDSYPWKDASNMRNKIVHSYETVDFEIVWKTASEDIAKLLEYCNQILKGNE